MIKKERERVRGCLCVCVCVCCFSTTHQKYIEAEQIVNEQSVCFIQVLRK